jgi:tetratricopeptide (TPR) repeat protein
MTPAGRLPLDEVLRRSDELVERQAYADEQQLLEEAVGWYPENAELRLRLAGALIDEQPGHARPQLVLATEPAPGEPLVLLRVADMYVSLGDGREGALRAARVCADEDFPFTSDLVWIGGKIALLHDELPLAEQMFDAAFDAQPRKPGFAESLADLLAAQGRDAEAREVIARALRVRPGDGGLLERLVAVASGDEPPAR